MTVSVDPYYLDDLARWQDAASKTFTSAKQNLTGTSDSSPNTYAEKLRWDHGPICDYTVVAIKKALQERKKSANAMKQVSDELSARLTSSADDYTGTEEKSTTGLGEQMV